MVTEQIETPAQVEEQAPSTDDATGQKAETPKQNGGTGRAFTQAEVDQMIQDRLERQKRTLETNAEKARRDAEAQQLAQQGEYQKLAEQRAQELQQAQTRLQEFDAVTQQRDRMKAALGAVLAKEREGLPPHVIELLDTKDEADQLEYIAKHRDALRPPETRAVPDINAGGGQSTPDPAAREAELKRRFRLG